MSSTTQTGLTADEAAAAVGVSRAYWFTLAKRHGAEPTVSHGGYGRPSHLWDRAAVDRVRAAHRAARAAAGTAGERRRQQAREWAREKASRDRERLADLALPTLYGLLSAADAIELERRKAKFAAA